MKISYSPLNRYARQLLRKMYPNGITEEEREQLIKQLKEI